MQPGMAQGEVVQGEVDQGTVILAEPMMAEEPIIGYQPQMIYGEGTCPVPLTVRGTQAKTRTFQTRP